MPEPFAFEAVLLEAAFLAPVLDLDAPLVDFFVPAFERGLFEMGIFFSWIRADEKAVSGEKLPPETA